MYLEIDEGFPGHRKTIRLCAALKNTEAAWYVVRLWTWACRSCPTGDLTGMGPYDIEIAVQYRPLDGACYAAMVAAGFIDEVDGQPASIHNWMIRTGAAIHRMDAAAARKKTYRAHKDGRCGGDCQFCTPRETSTDCPQDIPAPGDGRFNTDKTRQVQSPDSLSPVFPSEPQKPPERAIPVVPSTVVPAPFRAAAKPYPVGAITEAFLAAFRRYPNQSGRVRAAATWQDAAAMFPGGEAALSKVICAAFDAGLLKQHPYNAEHRYRPTFEKFLAEGRWTDPVVTAADAAARAPPPSNVRVGHMRAEDCDHTAEGEQPL